MKASDLFIRCLENEGVEDIAREETDSSPIVASLRRRPVAEKKAIARAADLLRESRRPIVLIGAGANRTLTAKMLREFIDTQDLPFITTQMGKSVVVLILNDAAYGMIRWKQADMGFDDFGLEFGNPDFVKYAESYGATGHRIARDSDFAPTLEKAFTTGGVHLIDLPVDYSENQRILFEEIPNESAALPIPCES